MKNRPIDILFLHLSEYSFPIPRVRTMAEGLANFGYNVGVICVSDNGKNEEIVDGVIVYNIRVPKSLKWFLPFFVMYTSMRMAILTIKLRPKAIQIFSPLLIPVSIMLKLVLNMKIIYDCYEYWEGSAKTERKRFSLLVYSIYHKLFFIFGDGIIFVYPKHPLVGRIRGLTKLIFYNVPKNKILRASCDNKEKLVSRKENSHNLSNHIVLGYLGIIMKYKGYEKLLSCLTYLPKYYKLILIGGTNDTVYMKKIVSLINTLNLKHRVIITGLLPYDKALSILSSVDLAVLPFEDTPWTKYSLPNKLFEYMACSKSIIATKLENFKIILDKNRYNILSELSPVDIANQILTIGENRKHAKKGGVLNKKIFYKEYSEDIMISKYYRFILELITK